MPRFYISFQNGDQIAQDDDGQDFRDLEEAREAALASAREILADNIKSKTSNALRAVMIADEDHHILLTIPARDALPEHLTQARK